MAPPIVAIAVAGVGLLFEPSALALLAGFVAGTLLALMLGFWSRRRLRHLATSADRGRHGEVANQPPAAATDEIDAAAFETWRLAADFVDVQQRSRESIARLSFLIDTIQDGLMQVDANGKVLFANVTAGTMFGGRNPTGSSLIRVTRDHELDQALRRCLRSGNDERLSIDTLNDHRHIAVEITRLAADPAEALVVLRDTTDVHRLQNLRRDFVANVSHELRTPLSTIKILTETLMELRERDEEAVGFLTRIDNEVDAMTALVRDLLDLARLESRHGGLAAEPVDGGRLVRDVCERMSSLAARQGVTLRPSLPERPIAVLGDERRLHQALLNLVRNAVDHSPPGSAVVVSLEDTGEWAAFEVRDSGTGIATEDLPRIWERFYKTDRARTGEGTGLGLAIVKHIVQAHGGTVDATSTLGQGSTFGFRIPKVDNALRHAEPASFASSALNGGVRKQ